MTKHRGLIVLRLVLGVVIIGYSVALVVSQFRNHRHHVLMLLGVAEFAAAVLLLIPGTLRAGGIALMVVFAFAVLFHVLHHQYSGIGYLAIYAAAAFAIVSDTYGTERR